MERGLDFADAELMFAGLRITLLDDRRAYGEPRFITAGYLCGRFAWLFGRPATMDDTSFR